MRYCGDPTLFVTKKPSTAAAEARIMSILRRQVIPTTRSSAKTSSGIVKPATVWAAPPRG